MEFAIDCGDDSEPPTGLAADSAAGRTSLARRVRDAMSGRRPNRFMEPKDAMTVLCF